MEPFVVRHYTGEERPVIKGNGFDGLEVGETREEAERFVAFVNAIRAQTLEEAAQMFEALGKDLAAMQVRALRDQ
jgi:hypothetical protein